MIMRSFSPRLLALGLVLITGVAPAAVGPGTTLPTWRTGPNGDLAFETSAFLAHTAYRKPEGTLEQTNPDGAKGPLNQHWDETHQGNWLIEEQRYGSDSVIAGLIAHRQDLIDNGLKVFDWGFRMQNPDGGFPCPDRFHSTSFFVEAVAHSALLLQASGMAAQNQAWVDGMMPKLHGAAEWMADPRNSMAGQQHDLPYTHRFYLDADALGETGVLTHDDALVKLSRQYVRNGIAAQRQDGANPEKGGTDTSYHAVGLLFALNYYTLVANDEMRAALNPMIDRGMNWLGARVGPDGVVDQAGNTRTGNGQERGPQGNLKTMSYGSAYRACFYWAMITRDQKWANLAVLLFQGQHVEQEERKAGTFHPQP